MILIFQKLYMSGEDIEGDDQCLKDRKYTDYENLTSLQRILKIEVDGNLSSVEGKIGYVFGWRKNLTSVVKETIYFSFIHTY